jgi:hypothetical protein
LLGHDEKGCEDLFKTLARSSLHCISHFERRVSGALVHVLPRRLFGAEQPGSPDAVVRAANRAKRLGTRTWGSMDADSLLIVYGGVTGSVERPGHLGDVPHPGAADVRVRSHRLTV